MRLAASAGQSMESACAMLPDLSRLAVGAGLFDYLAKSAAGKDKCTRHKEPVETDEDVRDNCAIEGYLMLKSLAAVGDVKPVEFLGKEVTVSNAVFKPLLTRTKLHSASNRHQYLIDNHRYWIESVFPKICSRGEGNRPITFKDYHALTTVTDWYVLDPDERGHLFVSLAHNKTTHSALKLPDIGLFRGRVLFVVLVCSNAPKFGTKMMAATEELAAKLGCDAVALASMSNSVGFYFNAGYQFVSKNSGAFVDVSDWVEEQQRPDGSTRRFLKNENAAPPPPLERGTKRSAPDDRNDDDDGDASDGGEPDGPVTEGQSRLRDSFYKTLSRAKQFWRWSMLSGEL